MPDTFSTNLPILQEDHDGKSELNDDTSLAILTRHASAGIIRFVARITNTRSGAVTGLVLTTRIFGSRYGGGIVTVQTTSVLGRTIGARPFLGNLNTR